MYVQSAVKLSTVIYRSRCSNSEFLANEIRQTSPSSLTSIFENIFENVDCGWYKLYYGVATVSKMDKIIRLFCKRDL